MQAIVDTGPLVAFFDRSERHHLWAAERVEELDAPLLVREPVLTDKFPLGLYHGKCFLVLLRHLTEPCIFCLNRLPDGRRRAPGRRLRT